MAKTTPTKKTISTKKTAKKTVSRAPKATAAKRTRATKATSNKVDYYPNRMTVAVSVLAGTTLVLLAVITVLGSHS